ncbi:MAG TPA: hypothetical protein VE197_21995, partial [Mycobacterium sp.]|nr:hypothetical protein [Mycobacterium sp.]
MAAVVAEIPGLGRRRRRERISAARYRWSLPFARVASLRVVVFPTGALACRIVAAVRWGLQSGWGGMHRALEVVVRRAALGGRSAVFVSGLATLLMVLVIPVGSAQASLAPTPVPYMGWNTYYGVGGVFDEAAIKSVAEALISTGLAQAGFKIVWLDFGWATGARASNGNLVVDPTQWPDGMSGLTSWLHA